jgi:hypothetical protein
LRTLVAVCLAVAVGIFAFAAGMGLTRSLLAASLMSAVVAALVGWRTLRHPWIALDEGA